MISGGLLLGSDPELEGGEQILQAVREVDWNEIKDNKWYPEELHNRLENDLNNKINNIAYLGIKDFTK